MLEGRGGRKRRRLETEEESDLEDSLNFASIELQSECHTSMLTHTSPQLSQDQGVSMVAHSINPSYSTTCPWSTHATVDIASLASHIVTHTKMSDPGSLPALTSFASHTTPFHLSLPPNLIISSSPAPRGRKRAGSDLDVKDGRILCLSQGSHRLRLITLTDDLEHELEEDEEHECTWCPERAMTALTPSHKRIRMLEEEEGGGGISDEYEDLDVKPMRGAVEEKQPVVKDEELCGKRKEGSTNDMPFKSRKIQAELHHEEAFLSPSLVWRRRAQEMEDKSQEHLHLVAEEVELNEKATKEPVAAFFDEGQQDAVGAGGKVMPKKHAPGDGKGEMLDEKLKFQNGDQESFEEPEQEIIDEEEEMLAYLWPGSGRRGVL